MTKREVLSVYFRHFHKPYQKGAVVPEFSRCRYRVKETRVFKYPKLFSIRIPSTLFTE
jgi:hypothetical protein